MKSSWIKWLGLAALAAGAGVLVHRQTLRQQALVRAAAEAAFTNERAALNAALAATRGVPVAPRETVVRTVSTPSLTGDELLARLAQLRPGSAEAGKSRREIAFLLESLVRLGPTAVPPIRQFLLRFEDISYSEETNPEAEEAPATPAAATAGPARRGPGRGDPRRELLDGLSRLRNGGRRPQPRLEFSFPPSLRLGLVDVLRDLGGESAEAALGEMLQRTSRALEVAYVARTLQGLSGDRWRDPAVATARELLLGPPVTGSHARVDRRAEDYLYAVFALFNDTSFAAAAGEILVRTDGSMDRGAFGYLTRSMGNNALPTLQAAFFDPRLTNLMDRASLLQQALPLVGQDANANAMFTSAVSDTSVPAELRGVALAGLAPRRGEQEPDLAQLQARYELLQTVGPSLNEPELQRAYQRVNQRLSEQITGQPAAKEPRRGVRTSGRSGLTPP